MNENQRKWLLYLQEKGIVIECRVNSPEEFEKASKFELDTNRYQFPAQPIPDIPGWRELCREMHSKGVKFEAYSDYGEWIPGELIFAYGPRKFRIPQQPLPEWREEMAEETKPDPREEIPHRELQIQWHEDVLHHLRTGEPMREWEYRGKKYIDSWETYEGGKPNWCVDNEYRRKPKTITYWHCLVDGYGTTGVVYVIESTSEALIKHVKSLGYEVVGQVTETTVEIED